jgi:Trp operon repressor
MANNYHRELVNNLTQIQSDKNMRLFLEALLTPDELDDLGKRLQIFKRLLKGESQREIAKDLKIAIATVERGASELKKRGEKVERIIKQ